MIDWQRPFATAPRDGRPILAWYEEEREVHIICFHASNWIPNDEAWRFALDGEVIEDPEYNAWAEINPPEREESYSQTEEGKQ